jgi:predicted SnoaL-like aldol condensation-catalyzing enzyme
MNEEIAASFLTMVIQGKIEEAYQKYVSFEGKHHNMHTPSGFKNLLQAMQAAEEHSPNKQFHIKNIFGKDDLVAVHSHLIINPEENGMATVHMFRFEKNKIVEMWDIAQQIPEDQINSDGAF